MYYRNKNCARSSRTQKQLNLSDTMRRLWTEHVMWTRSFIISTVNKLGDLEYVTKRLLRNPADFAEELKPFYGASGAARFGKLLTEHLQIGAKLVNAASAGDSKTADEARVSWYANAEELANFLSEINPAWSAAAWQTMLNEHLKMTESEATQIIGGQYDAGISQYDSIQKQALNMADYMTEGLIRQFSIS